MMRRSVSLQHAIILGVLAENGRLGLLNEVINSFEEIVRANRGDLTVQVVSAEELNPASKKQISDALSKGNKKVECIQQNWFLLRFRSISPTKFVHRFWVVLLFRSATSDWTCLLHHVSKSLLRPSRRPSKD